MKFEFFIQNYLIIGRDSDLTWLDHLSTCTSIVELIPVFGNDIAPTASFATVEGPRPDLVVIS